MFTVSGYDSKFWLTKNVFIIIINITIYIITTIIIELSTANECSEKQHHIVKKATCWDFM